jgi:cytochrome c peroxidase
MKATVADGKTLFSDTSLGRNQKSCTTCHPGGKGLEGALPSTSESSSKPQ